jgi:hypothetical protein
MAAVRTFKDTEKIHLSIKDHCLRVTWKEGSVNLLDVEFMEINEKYLELIEAHKLKSFFIDTRKFYYTIDPEMQAWVGENILSKLPGLGIKRLAFLMSEEFIAQLSIEQTMDNLGESCQMRYFDDREEAIEWVEKV